LFVFLFILLLMLSTRILKEKRRIKCKTLINIGFSHFFLLKYIHFLFCSFYTQLSIFYPFLEEPFSMKSIYKNDVDSFIKLEVYRYLHFHWKCLLLLLHERESKLRKKCDASRIGTVRISHLVIIFKCIWTIVISKNMLSVKVSFNSFRKLESLLEFTI